MRPPIRLLAALVAGAALVPAAPARAVVNADGAGRVPWQALVRVRFSAQAGGRCGATIRDALHVITAAHCTSDRPSRAVEPWALPARALTVTAGVASTGARAQGAQRR